MAKNKKTLRDDPAPFISRSYDLFSMEKRIYNLEKGGGGTPTPSSSWDYSTTETNTNQKWIDGKDIYCKVFVFDSLRLINQASSYVDLLNADEVRPLNIDRLIDVTSFGMYDTYNTTIFKTFFSYERSTEKIKIFPLQSGNHSGAIVFYTKRP